MRILWASPLPPIRSGVSDYAVDLLKELGSRARVRVVRPPEWSPPTDWPLGDSVELVAMGTPPEDEEIAVVHLGNNPHHLWVLDLLGGRRTAVVLHDLTLHHLLVEAAGRNDRFGRFEECIREAHGQRGGSIATARSLGLSARRDPFLFPARTPFIGGAEAVVVHSQWAESTLHAEFPNLEVGTVDLPVADPGAVERHRVREEYGIAESEVVLMHLGFLTPEKGLQDILGGLASACRSGVPARLLVVGEGSSGIEMTRAAEAAGIADRVSATGWLHPSVFPTAPAAADLGVVLRSPSAGETSAAAIRFLACGTPVAVGGRNQFLELPEAAAPRLTPGASAAADLARLLVSIHSDGPAWARRRNAARASYEASHTPARAATQLLNFLEGVF